MILIISSPADEHATAVMTDLMRLGAQASLVDLSRFPETMRLEIRYSAEKPPRFTLTSGDAAEHSLGSGTAVWWRRPQGFGVPSQIRRESFRSFAYNETAEAFAGLWQAIDVFWVNHPTRDEVAARKVYQLRIASEVGLRIPDTLVTNDSDAARRFISKRGPSRTVFKAFSATQDNWRETRIITEQELKVLHNVGYAPVIFQEYIPAGVDLRVTVVGEQMFPAAIHTADSSYEFDCRMDMMQAPIEPTSLPPKVEAGLRELMCRLGLVYGAIDMRVTSEGEYVFLEVNPSGQWLFIESRTGQPITATLAKLLAERATVSRQHT